MNNKWFTLVEILVWISISMILMISIWFLISWWIKNITSQEKIIKDSWDFLSFESKINNYFQNINTNFEPIKTNSWIILKINQNYDEWGFIYIWETKSPLIENSWIYCSSWSETVETKHIFIKTFIPEFDIDTQKSHIINWIWKWFFWYNEVPETWLELDEVYLNNPTWLESSWSIDFISDTLNNRILYKSWTKIYELLNKNDWLLEPTDLKIISWDLYIANSASWEILRYSSENIVSPELNINWINWNNITEFKISFYNQDWDKNISINDISDIEIENHTILVWDNYNISWNELTFTFSWWTNHNFTDNYIKINNLSDFSSSWTYYIKLDINNKFYKYFTQSDDNILTKDDNSLEIIDNSNDYYTKINSIWNYNKFSDNSDKIYNRNYDYILKSPIKELNIDYTDQLLNIELKYYKKYNCYNTDEKIERTLILKKNFK